MADLIVEDGSVVTGANTYVSLDYVEAYCSDRGLTSWTAATATSAKREAIFRAMDYIESQPFKGVKTDYDNPCQFPRFGLYLDVVTYTKTINNYQIDTYVLDDDEIPENLKRAQAQAAYEEFVSKGCLLSNMDREAFILRKKIDIIETEYQPGKEETKYRKIKALLREYIEQDSSSTVVRT